MATIGVLLASLVLAATAPIIALACLLVRLTSRGPVIYVQRRLGFRGRIFKIHKIRTMYKDSEPDGPRWCVRGDRRITPIGRFLRWTHIDELPQLINILRGDMALVGPRPERPEIAAELERAFPQYQRRLWVRPGLTGLAQVLRPPDSDLATVRQKLDLDLYYLEHASLLLDVRIVLATLLHVLRIPPALIARTFGFPVELIRPLDMGTMDALVRLELPSTVSEPCSAG
jgi:lipopolysaccharide/colanic/teichoic acid biosynthesis glycosyltransferase